MRKLGRPSPAMVVAVVALVVACTGTAVAAQVITSSSQIKNGVVTGGDIRNGSVKGTDVKNGSLTGSDLKAGSVKPGNLSASVRAAMSGGDLTAQEAVRVDGPRDVKGTDLVRVATLKALPAGVYVIQAKTVVQPGQGVGPLQLKDTTGARCKLDAGGVQDQGNAFFKANAAEAPATVTMQMTRTLTAATDVFVACQSDTAWSASNTSIIALRVAKAPRTDVTD